MEARRRNGGCRVADHRLVHIEDGSDDPVDLSLRVMPVSQRCVFRQGDQPLPEQNIFCDGRFRTDYGVERHLVPEDCGSQLNLLLRHLEDDGTDSRLSRKGSLPGPCRRGEKLYLVMLPLLGH
jgi:hypothetical protein